MVGAKRSTPTNRLTCHCHVTGRDLCCYWLFCWCMQSVGCKKSQEGQRVQVWLSAMTSRHYSNHILHQTALSTAACVVTLYPLYPLFLLLLFPSSFLAFLPLLSVPLSSLVMLGWMGMSLHKEESVLMEYTANNAKDVVWQWLRGWTNEEFRCKSLFRNIPKLFPVISSNCSYIHIHHKQDFASKLLKCFVVIGAICVNVYIFILHNI